MKLFADPHSRGYARITGLFYMIIAMAGFFAILYVPGQLFTPGDGAASLVAISARRGLFNAGIGGDVAVMLAELMATAMLFFMFRHVNETLAFAAALARMMMVAVMAAMLFFYAAALALAGPEFAGIAGETRAALGGLMLHLHDTGVVIWQLFFFAHLIILGQLVARSGLFPRALGYAMSLGSIGYLCDSLNKFLELESGAADVVTGALLAIVSFAEIGFALWLIVRGPRPAARA